MSRVFIPQDPTRRNRATGEWERSIDLTPAEKFGSLVFLLQSGRAPEANSVVAVMSDKLRDYSGDDYLLPVGDPSLIAVMAILAAAANDGCVRMLMWSRQTQDYYVSEIWTQGEN